jgi:hypothetical protein
VDYQQVTAPRWPLVRFDDDELPGAEEAGEVPHLSDAEMVVVRLILETTLDRHYSGDDLTREEEAIRAGLIGALGKFKGALAGQLPSAGGA